MKHLLFAVFAGFALSAHASQVLSDTNKLVIPPDQYLEHVTFGIAQSIEMSGRTHDDTFWLTPGELTLAGNFGNDVWGFADSAELTGSFSDHARVAARYIKVDGHVSNGLWAAGLSISTTTNTHLTGDQFLLANNLTLLGHIDGNVYARANQITIGGTVSGNVYLQGNDIVIRPGTVIAGDLVYVSSNQTIVLDDQSFVRGDLRKAEPPAVIEQAWSPGAIGLIQLYWFAGAVIAGIPFIMLFPSFTGTAVQQLRSGLWKCGLAGLIIIFIAPFAIIAIAFTVIGVPFSLVLGASYLLIVYLGKYPVALAIGTALLQRRGQISLANAVVALVCGLILFYAIALAPYIGSSLQAAASAFGAGSMILALAAGRGRVRSGENS